MKMMDLLCCQGYVESLKLRLIKLQKYNGSLHVLYIVICVFVYVYGMPMTSTCSSSSIHILELILHNQTFRKIQNWDSIVEAHKDVKPNTIPSETNLNCID